MWKVTALMELSSFFIDVLSFELGKLFLGVGICSLFQTWSQSFTLKSCLQGRGFDKKRSGLGVGVGMGGMVTDQIDININRDFRADLLRHSTGLYHFITN